MSNHDTNPGPQGREMYYNIRNSSITQETKANAFCSSKMPAGLEASEPVSDGRPLGEASPLGVVSQEACGSGISAGFELAWVAAQWTWASERNQRLRVAMTFMTPQDILTRTQPKRITFYLTDRLREFRPTNDLQQRVATVAALQQVRWIGKARIRQRAGQPVEDYHRRNIPDMVMTAQVQDEDLGRPWIKARLYTIQQQIDLDFTHTLTPGQRRYYLGAAIWGCRPGPKDDFYDWQSYA